MTRARTKAEVARAELVEAAARVRERAHAPYSRFLVGAALRGKSGRIYVGCNVENSSYGLSMCAERAAVFTAVAAGETEFVSLAVVSQSSPASAPCGACRQVLSEFAADLEIILVGPDGAQEITGLAELLPRAFDKSFL